MNSPKISVIVLTLNSERFIARALYSLVRQSEQDFEVIVVDAGSTDRTREIVAGFGDRFKWLELPKSDMGAARNFGVRASRGRYLMFLDSDDFYLKDKLRKQATFLDQAPEVDALFGPAWIYRTGDPTRIGIKRTADQAKTLKDFVGGFNYTLGTMCVRRTVWERGIVFGEGDSGRYGEDWRLQLMMVLNGIVLAVQPDPFVVVEIRPDSHTGWNRQLVMKQMAVNEAEKVSEKLTSNQRHEIDMISILDSFRFKLVTACLLDKRFEQASMVARSIDGRRSRFVARVACGLASFIPAPIFRRLVQQLWIRRQNKSFVWQPCTIALREEFLAIEKGAIGFGNATKVA